MRVRNNLRDNRVPWLARSVPWVTNFSLRGPLCASISSSALLPPPRIELTDRHMSCHLLGSEALLINCADVLLERGHVILGMVSDAPAITAWCTNLGVRAIPAKIDYARIPAERPRDYPLSSTNLTVAPAAALKLPGNAAFVFHDGPLPRHAGLFAPASPTALGAPDAPSEGLGRTRLTDLRGK